MQFHLNGFHPGDPEIFDPAERVQPSGAPGALPEEWLRHVAPPQTDLELAALRRSVTRGSPYGEEGWRRRTAKKLGLETTLRPRGRPRLGQSGTK